MCNCDEIKKTDSFVIAWRVWYENGNGIQSFNSSDHDFNDLPDIGFQAMKLFYADGTGRVISGYDFYFFACHPEGTIFGQTNNEKDLDQYEFKIIKKGKHTTDGLMKQISDAMFESENPLRNAD